MDENQIPIEPVPEVKKPFPWIWVVVGVVVLLLIGSGAYYFIKPNTETLTPLAPTGVTPPAEEPIIEPIEDKETDINRTMGEGLVSGEKDSEWFASIVEVDKPIVSVRFDYEFPLEKGEGVLSIHFEGEIIFLIYESQTTPGVHTAEVSLDKEYPPGSYSLGFRVDSETKSELEISNVSFLGYTDVEN
jgi:hypothetical protein